MHYHYVHYERLPINNYTDETCELQIDDNLQLLSLNQTYSPANEPCMIYKCIKDAKIISTIQKCNIKCKADEIHRKFYGSCCGECIKAFCYDNEKKFNPGETWKSPDNCTINECIDDGREIQVNAYKKTCPKLQNCPELNIEIRDCCSYCNYRKESKLKLYKNLTKNFDLKFLKILILLKKN